MTSSSQEQISLTRCPSLCLISDTPKGRGVFATAFIPRGTVLETSPILLLSPTENRQHIEKTVLYHYTYNWPAAKPEACRPENSDSSSSGSDGRSNRRQPAPKYQALVLGLGSLFNHSRYQQNVVWTRDVQNAVIVYRALRDVEAGEELCISYGDHLTFVDADGGREGEDSKGREESWGLDRIEIESD